MKSAAPADRDRGRRQVAAAGADNRFEGQVAGNTLRQTRNVGAARLRRVEVSYQQPYTFLPGFWRGLGAFADFTSTRRQCRRGPE
ncbi:MAG: hypothetical protein JNL92_21135 [Opitutaceae bacterium]|nr:hypothetical protein [Opitutaceae bacterium]